MKTIGEFLKQARLKQEKSLDNISKITKIRPDYLEKLEDNQFQALPSAAFVKGFITNYAKAVNIDPNTALAIFRRDFDQNHQGRIIPRGLTNPLKTPSKVWTPRTTATVFAIILAIFVGAYIFRQLLSLTQAPTIEIFSPTQTLLTTNNVTVSGKTSSDATLTVNSKPISLDIQGHFQTNLDLSVGQHTITIQAESRDGKVRTQTITLTIEPGF